ncbi:MAG: single-stranded DNA-binding protein [Bacteroidales bacterium]|nr:single-stranded DNA-binding protein [Candidatus Cryptobacteroides equifaecalis]
MEQLNKIELRGIVGSVRVQSFNDASVARISLVTSLAYKDKDGAPVIEETWHSISAWEGREIQNLDKIKVGSKLYVCGRIRNQRFTGNDGVDRSVNEVMAKRLFLIEDEESLSCQM